MKVYTGQLVISSRGLAILCVLARYCVSFVTYRTEKAFWILTNYGHIRVIRDRVKSRSFGRHFAPVPARTVAVYSIQHDYFLGRAASLKISNSYLRFGIHSYIILWYYADPLWKFVHCIIHRVKKVWIITFPTFVFTYWEIMLFFTKFYIHFCYTTVFSENLPIFFVHSVWKVNIYFEVI